MYSWVTYGITTLLERMWREHGVRVAMGHNTGPSAIEVCCALERTLAYAYTGNAKVLSRALMEPLFITRSLLEHGLPTINTDIVKFLSTPESRVIIIEKEWPTTKAGPITCSKGAHILRYGMSSWMVRNISHVNGGTSGPSARGCSRRRFAGMSPPYHLPADVHANDPRVRPC